MTPFEERHMLPPHSVIQSNQIVLDIVYNPIETALLKIARQAGARTVSGIEMLLGQGAKAFELFTDNEFPINDAREVLMKELMQFHGYTT